MGNSDSSSATRALKDFQMQKYLNQGLNQHQILQIREAFDSYAPENGLIDLDKMRHCTEQSQSKEKI
jgi:hypothetical protein